MQLKPVYLKQENPLWIFKVHSRGGAQIYMSMGCKRIRKKEFDKYPKKGRQ